MLPPIIIKYIPKENWLLALRASAKRYNAVSVIINPYKKIGKALSAPTSIEMKTPNIANKKSNLLVSVIRLLS